MINISQTYIDFAAMATRGYNPDGFYHKHRMEIDFCAYQMRLAMKEPGSLYRGMLLEPSLVPRYDLQGRRILRPLKHIKFISFSESREMAETFADPSHPFCDIFRICRPAARGYIAEYVPSFSEVLFHWKWPEQFGFSEHFNMNVLRDQQEVILIGGIPLNITRFDGPSNHSVNRIIDKYDKGVGR